MLISEIERLELSVSGKGQRPVKKKKGSTKEAAETKDTHEDIVYPDLPVEVYVQKALLNQENAAAFNRSLRQLGHTSEYYKSYLSVKRKDDHSLTKAGQ